MFIMRRRRTVRVLGTIVNWSALSRTEFAQAPTGQLVHAFRRGTVRVQTVAIVITVAGAQNLRETKMAVIVS